MSNFKFKTMAKKYTNTDLKSLKRDEIIGLLKKEGVEFDETQPFFSLRKLLLDIEVEDNTAEQADLFENSQPVAEVAEPVAEVAEPVKEEKPKVDKKVAHASFQNELSKRMATFGRAKQSVFSIELARRQGKVTGKISFEEELKLRRNKAKR